MKTRATLPNQTQCYHCMSRTVHGERWLNDREKAALQSLIWRVADFCGVRVLTYCILSNHFHILVEVPPASASEAVSDRELVRRYRVLNGEKPPRGPGALSAIEVEACLEKNDGKAAELRKRLKARMCNLSIFMETLKNRFTRWYNHHHETFGTVWAARFNSVLVANEAATLKNVATYIDLNPVRAGLVNDPGKYPFSGFAEANNGYKPARDGILHLTAYAGKPGASTFRAYTELLYARGSIGAGPGKGGHIPMEIVRQVLGARYKEVAAESAPLAPDGIYCRAYAVGPSQFLAHCASIIGVTFNRKAALRIQTDESSREAIEEVKFGYLNQQSTTIRKPANF